ncbi:hypothetical protein BESB_056640 [Besnoitia besnoiti]|uniref:Spen paralogue and orthologue SPOC C-terminal domain-containing protein n=1 Tax=Besnoitia besnoiti TaxID=94643 RepID=A0A2A9MK22_BESBE|nr:hypothetical protein BESB_056640 [Besnoitia besnoiti]PFH36013.1 hypothetical protein BESB_056640 [Besnoitia besnoiti]
MGPGADGSYGMMTGMPGEPSRMRSGGAQSCARGPPLASERDRSPFPGPSSKRQRRYYDEYSYRGGERGVSNRGSSSPEPASSSMLRRDRRRSPPFYGGPAADRRGGGPGDHGMTALPPGGASRGGLGDGKPPLLDEDEREGGKGLGMRRDLSGGSPAGLDADGSPPAGPGRGRGSLSLERKRGDGRRSGCRGSIDQGEPTGKLGSGRREAGGGGDDDEDAGQLLMVCRVLKQGQRLCNMSAKFVGGDPNIRPPGVLDVNQRANLDRLQTHLRRGRQGVSSPHGGEGALRYSIWQLGADTRQDSRQYDELCDYFINKERVGLLESPSQAIYMVPPNPKYIKPLNLPDANFMYAYVIAK